MGNRAVITTEAKEIGVYLHWNGGRDSVEGFLAYCELKKYSPPEEDNYGWAYLCQVIANFMGNGSSVGIDLYKNLDRDNGDNGVYIIKNWHIIQRDYFSEEEQHGYTLQSMLESINECMPINRRLEDEEIKEYLKNTKRSDAEKTQQEIKRLKMIENIETLSDEAYRKLNILLHDPNSKEAKKIRKEYIDKTNKIINPKNE